jgi:hypothetical protein
MLGSDFAEVMTVQPQLVLSKEISLIIWVDLIQILNALKNSTEEELENRNMGGWTLSKATT